MMHKPWSEPVLPDDPETVQFLIRQNESLMAKCNYLEIQLAYLQEHLRKHKYTATETPQIMDVDCIEKIYMQLAVLCSAEFTKDGLHIINRLYSKKNEHCLHFAYKLSPDLYEREDGYYKQAMLFDMHRRLINDVLKITAKQK